MPVVEVTPEDEKPKQVASPTALIVTVTPTPKPTRKPVECHPVLGPEERLHAPFQLIPLELIDLFRITTCEIWNVGGGNLHSVVEQESDALIITRVAMGENPHSLTERMYIMWLIRLRAELGYKNAGRRGFVQPEASWWDEPTTIKQEALCIGGCQFAPVKMWGGVYFPANLKPGQLSAMVYPKGEQLLDFWHTYQIALIVLEMPMSNYPHEFRGYDEFRSSAITITGLTYREGGLQSRYMVRETFPYNIFRDVSTWDNVFWERLESKEN